MQGFTLIEVLLAMSLLAMGLVMAFAVVRSTQVISARGEAMAAESERMRAVDGFLRARLANALPIARSNGTAGPPVRFIGEPERMSFVADLPPYLGYGGPHVHELAVVQNGDRQRLELSLSLVAQNGGDAVPRLRAPDVLVDRLEGVRFRYRGRDSQGSVGDWQPTWPWPERMPLQVEVVLESGADRVWPATVVSLPQAGFGGAP